jgi:hypothetical protein
LVSGGITDAGGQVNNGRWFVVRRLVGLIWQTTTAKGLLPYRVDKETVEFYYLLKK